MNSVSIETDWNTRIPIQQQSSSVIIQLTLIPVFEGSIPSHIVMLRGTGEWGLCRLAKVWRVKCLIIVLFSFHASPINNWNHEVPDHCSIVRRNPYKKYVIACFYISKLHKNHFSPIPVKTEEGPYIANQGRQGTIRWFGTIILVYMIIHSAPDFNLRPCWYRMHMYWPYYLLARLHYYFSITLLSHNYFKTVWFQKPLPEGLPASMLVNTKNNH